MACPATTWLAMTHPMHTANWNGATAHQPSFGPARANFDHPIIHVKAAARTTLAYLSHLAWQTFLHM
jgi:hypothetical protein